MMSRLYIGKSGNMPFVCLEFGARFFAVGIRPRKWLFSRRSICYYGLVPCSGVFGPLRFDVGYIKFTLYED